MATGTGAFPLEMRLVPGRGRGLFAVRDIAAGETVLAESPLLLTVASEFASSACAQCLRALRSPAEGAACPTCHMARFCSPGCAQQAQLATGNHSPVICRCLAAAASFPPQLLAAEEMDQLRYLIHTQALKHGPPEAQATYQRLLSVVGDVSPGSSPPVKLHQALNSALAAAGLSVELAASLEEVATLLRKDELNSYGIMADSAARGERRIRGSGVYVHASLLNHECLPNVARFDSFDSPGPSNTVITIRALHNIPAGSEVLQSYFPLNWTYQERQERCREQYGFECHCQRCTLESKWVEDEESDEEESKESDMEDGDVMDDGGKGKMPIQQEEEEEAVVTMTAGGEDEEDTYQYLFLTKHTCPQEECFGTTAPLAAHSDVLECNMCGHRRTEADFMAELELQQRE